MAGLCFRLTEGICASLLDIQHDPPPWPPRWPQREDPHLPPGLLIIGRCAASTGELSNSGTKFSPTNCVKLFFLVWFRPQKTSLAFLLLFCSTKTKTWHIFKPWGRQRGWVLQHNLSVCFGWCRKGGGGVECPVMPGMLPGSEQYPQSGVSFFPSEIRRTAAHFLNLRVLFAQ